MPTPQLENELRVVRVTQETSLGFEGHIKWARRCDDGGKPGSAQLVLKQTTYESLKTPSQSSHSWHGDMQDIVDQ
jgi:hypothetical protein